MDGTREEPDRPFNRIGHAFDWDGTLRSYKALAAIERFHPRKPGDIARIWIEERNYPADMHEVQFPMFLEVPELVAFVDLNTQSANLRQWRNYYITHWDLTDSVADMWKLSPVLKLSYPSHNEMFNGVNIGMGWQDLLSKVRRILT